MVNNHQKVSLLLILTLFIASSVLANDVKTTLSRQKVQVGESFHIEFSSEAASLPDPQLQPLQANFDMRGTSRQVSHNIINGVRKSKHSISIELFPKKAGRFVIPSLRFGNLVSQPAVVEVTPIQQAQQARQDIFLQLITQSQNPYVQQQVSVTLKVWMHASKTLKGTLSNFTTDKDTIIKKVGNSRTYRSASNGQQYNVHEDRYLIHPQVSGQIRIQPIALNASYVQGGRRYGVRKSSNDIRLNVRPIPDSFTGIAWLPATEIKLSEKWAEDISSIQAGTPITRVITLHAHGLLSSQLPEIEVGKVEDLKIYPEKSELQDQLQDSRAQRIQKLVIIPTQDGQYTLPQIRVPWWNVKTDRMAYATLPAKILNIKEAPKSLVIASEPIARPEQPISGTPATSNNLWIWVSAFLLLGWISTSVFIWRVQLSHNADRRKIEHQEAQRQLSIRQAQKQLEQSCDRGDIGTTKSAILKWAALIWREKPPQTLAELAQVVENETLAEEVAKLDRALYSNHRDWNSQSLRVTLQAYFEQLKSHSANRSKKRPARLAALHKLK